MMVKYLLQKLWLNLYETPYIALKHIGRTNQHKNKNDRMKDKSPLIINRANNTVSNEINTSTEQLVWCVCTPHTIFSHFKPNSVSTKNNMVLVKKRKFRFLKGKLPIYNVYLKQHNVLCNCRKDRQNQHRMSLLCPNCLFGVYKQQQTKALKNNEC